MDHFIPLLDPPGSVWPGLALHQLCGLHSTELHTKKAAEREEEEEPPMFLLAEEFFRLALIGWQSESRESLRALSVFVSV